jgi:rhamnose transport system permease protein
MMISSGELTKTSFRRIGSFFLTQEGSLLVFLAIVVFVLSRLSREFATFTNLLSLSRLFVEVGLITLPMTMIIITGGTDLSVGSQFGWTSVMLGAAWQYWGLPLPVAVVVCLLCGLLGGSLNGIVITQLKIPPLIVTLATLAVFRGLAFGVSQARSVHGWPESFWFLGQGYIGPFPTQFLIWIALVVACGILLGRTALGRYIYSIGNNELGARFSGIPVNRIKFGLYAFSGLMSALAGVVFVSRVTTTRADAGVGMELDVITAVVLGGTSIYGGHGSILGTLLGLLTISFLRNGLSLAGVKGDATIIIIGAVLIISVFLNRLFERPLRA